MKSISTIPHISRRIPILLGRRMNLEPRATRLSTTNRRHRLMNFPFLVCRRIQLTFRTTPQTTRLIAINTTLQTTLRCRNNRASRTRHRSRGKFISRYSLFKISAYLYSSHFLSTVQQVTDSELPSDSSTDHYASDFSSSSIIGIGCSSTLASMT